MGCHASRPVISGASETRNIQKMTKLVGTLNLADIYKEDTDSDHHFEPSPYNSGSSSFGSPPVSDSEDWENVMTFSSFLNGSNTTLLNYEFHEMLGRGSHARVYLVHNIENDVDYAAKVFDKSHFNRIMIGEPNSAFDRVVNEMQIMSMLNHPNCIHLEEVLEDDVTNTIIFIMTYADKGALLKSSNDATALGEDTTKPIFYQISKAVKFIHENNIVHRDIKPENILLCNNGRAILSDFSASSVMISNNQLFDDTTGTPVFYSPEECTGNSYKPKPADIWSLGVSLYIMHYGHLPFFNVIENGIYLSQFYKISKQIQEDPVLFDENIPISPELKDLLLHMLDKDPETRYTIDEVINHPWFKDALSAYDSLTE